MKKCYLVLAVIMSLGLMKVFCEEVINVPSSGNNNSIPADYGGVDVATNSFTIGLATVPSGNGARGIDYVKFYASTTNISGQWASTRWRVYGVNFSTGVCANYDFVSIQVSSSQAGQARELTRIYNSVSISSSNAAQTNICGGFTTTRWPIRAYGNLFWGVNVDNPGGGTGRANPLNRADLLYYRESD